MSSAAHPIESASEPAWRARGRERRELLLERTLELIGREGIDAVSHRRVAQHSGVPLGSTTYYFSSREDMLVQALSHFARAEIAALVERLGPLPGRDPSPRRVVDELVAFLAPQVADRRWRTVAQYALFGEAARRPQLAAVAREWNEAWWALLEDLLAGLGVADPRLEARMFLAMLDGLLLAELAAPEDGFAEQVLGPALERWLRRAAADRDG